MDKENLLKLLELDKYGWLITQKQKVHQIERDPYLENFESIQKFYQKTGRQPLKDGSRIERDLYIKFEKIKTATKINLNLLNKLKAVDKFNLLGSKDNV